MVYHYLKLRTAMELTLRAHVKFTCLFCMPFDCRKGFFALPDPSEEEEDMLDLAWGLTHTLDWVVKLSLMTH